MISEQRVREWINFYLDPKLSVDDIDRRVKRLPSETEIAEFLRQVLDEARS